MGRAIKLSFAGALCVMLAGPLQAADVAAPVLKAPVKAGGSWTGWYGGLQAGWAHQRNCHTLSPQGLWPQFPDDAAFLEGLGNGCASASGFIGGAQAGANYQTGSWVLGFEADISALSNKMSRTSTGIFPSTPTGILTESASTPWLATFRPRVGSLIDPDTLVYVTGGLAVAHVKSDTVINYFEPDGAPRALSVGSVSQTTYGWTAGAGVEKKVGGNWSVKAEYLYADLKSVDYSARYIQVGPIDFGNFNELISAPTKLHIVRLGANYRFGESAGASSAYASATSAPAVYNWTGPYAGLNFGGVFGKSTATDVDCCGNGPWNAVGDTFAAKTKGIVGGVQAGYNWQSNAWVAGLEADVGYLGFRGDGASPIAFDTVVSGKGGLYGTLRGRLGWAVDRTLFYGTGGLIVADTRTGVDDPWYMLPYDGPLSGILFTDKTRTQAGWVAGGGVEYALGGIWSVKGEYLYFDLGSKRVTGASPNAGIPPANVYGYDIHNSGSILRLGVNAKL